MYVLDFQNSLLFQFAANASLTPLLTIQLEGGGDGFTALVVGNDSIVYVSDDVSIFGYAVNGSLVSNTSYNAGALSRSFGLVAEGDGSFALAELFTHSVIHVARNGTILGSATSPFASAGYYQTLALQPNSNTVWIADHFTLTSASTVTQRIISRTSTELYGSNDQYIAVDNGTYMSVAPCHSS